MAWKDRPTTSVVWSMEPTTANTFIAFAATSLFAASYWIGA